MPYDLEMEEYEEEMKFREGPKKCLVTGGAGFVGTNLVKRLLNDGHQVVVFDNYSTGFRENQVKGVRYGDIDIRESFSNWAEDVDVIFHMAALPRIGPSFDNPTEVVNVNVNGTANVLEYARLRSVPVIYAGSSSFWGGVYKNPYTFSKWQGEELCKLYERIYGLNVTVCRFYNVYGNHMPTEGEYRTVIPIFLEQYKNGEPLTITGDGEQRRDFTHVDDIVDAMVRVVKLNKWGSTYELGIGENHSINELAEMFRFGELPHDTPPTKYIDSIPGEVRNTLCKSELARKKLRWKPEVNLKEWIEEQL
jgi:UDP-glucose 4-epimerase